MVSRRSIRILTLTAMLSGSLVAGASFGQAHDHGSHDHGKQQDGHGSSPAHPAPQEEAAPESSEIRIEVKGGYEVGPGTLKKGQPARLVFVRHDSGECSREVVFPSLGIKKELALGETVIEITPTKAGKLAFTCGMEMMKGELKVSK